MMTIRGTGAMHAYRTCRSFRLGRLHSLWRAARYRSTGSTGKYRIQRRTKAC